jgi:hypothetical protein
LAAAVDTADCTFSTTPHTTCWRRLLHMQVSEVQVLKIACLLVTPAALG